MTISFTRNTDRSGVRKMIEQRYAFFDTKHKVEVPIWEKSNLTIEEAAAYSGIGQCKLRQMTDDENCPFVLWVGSKRMIKRRKLDAFLDDEYSI